MKTRICMSCSKVKNIRNFYKKRQKHKKSGKTYYFYTRKCKICYKIKVKKYRVKRKLYFRNYRNKWNTKNPQKVRFQSYKGHAKETKREFNLTFTQFIQFWRKSCYYCTSKIKTIGLDRVDNNKGYTINNIVSCCIICNKMKQNLSKTRFINHCKRIIN